MHWNSRRNKGSMPFALVAVTILLTVAAYGIVSGSVKDCEDNSENAVRELGSMDGAVRETEAFIERGLSEMLYDSCTAGTGKLEERISGFRERSDSWLGYQFPANVSGITVTLKAHEIEVTSENFTSGDRIGGYVPSFLRASGTVTAVFETENGRAERELSVRTDGSCALPLVLEMGSLFENAVAGNGPILSQMVDYQLTSLAQYRVINGYGALNEYGEKGTRAIITEQDVRDAYRNALRAIECMYFRDSGGNTVFGDRDLAKDAVCRNGKLTLDLNMVYAQALASRVDDLVAKWFDYFLGNIAVDILDYISDALKNAWDSLVSFFTGKNEFSAEPYIREVVGNIDSDLRSGETFVLYGYFPEIGETVPLQLRYPDVDLYGSDTVTRFKEHYRADNNELRDWIRSVVNTAIAEIASGKGLGTVTLDISDPVEFSEALSDAVSNAVGGNLNSFESVAWSASGKHQVPDQFYSAIYDAIERNRDSIFCCNDAAFRNNIYSQVSIVYSILCASEGIEFTAEGLCAFCDTFISTDGYRTVLAGYQNDVQDLMGRLNSLNYVYGAGSSLLQRACVGILTQGFFAVDYGADISRIAGAMASEYRENISTNPYSGFTDLPESSEFVLENNGMTVSEKLEIAESSSPCVWVGNASSKSSHETGFSESKNAGYCTVIPVRIQDTVGIDISSSGSFLRYLGLCDARYSDRISVDIETEIAVVSGWALAGASYQTSTNILNDAWNLLLQALEPLLEPLRQVMRMAEDVIDRISQAIMTVNRYINELVEKIYNAIMEPLERLYQIFTDAAMEYLCNRVIDLAGGIQTMVDISAVGQIVSFTYMGYTLAFTFNLATLEKYTKNIVKAEFSGNVAGKEVSAFINVKTKGETKKEPFITGGFSIRGSDWDITAKIDPTMKTNKNLMTLSGTVRGIGIDAVLPQAIQYNEIGIRLSDFPGIAEILGNIPSPIPGTKVAIDAGLELKYNVPIETGVLINEFESNPEGTDKDNEWAEIINLTGSTVDLNDWTVTTSKDKVHIIKDIELAPGERTVICFPGTFLLNTKECLTLRDPDGVISDRTATMSDGSNDSRTCQRGMDGCTDWSLLDGTPGEANTGGLFGENGMVTKTAYNIVKKAAVKAMTEMRHVYTMEALQELFTRTVLYAVDDGINKIAACVVEGSAYVSVEFTDLTSAGRSGFRVYLMADSELVGDILRFLIGKIEALFLNIDDPYNIDIDSVIYDDVYVGVTVYGGIKVPSLLCASNSNSEKVTMGVDIACNLSAVGGLFGCDLGIPKVRAKIGIKNCPEELIPPALKMKKNMTYDYWFISMTFRAIA